MATFRNITIGSLCAAAVSLAGKAVTIAAALILTACSTMPDAVDAARTRITTHLTGNNIYERNNLPDNPVPPTIAGYFDIIGGAFRFIENETRAERDQQSEIVQGSLIAFRFDARIFSGSFANSTTFFTNIESQIRLITGTNNEFNTEFWPTVPLEVRIGEGTILKSLENALLSCREGDEMQIFLTPDIGFGDRAVGIVPARSTLVYRISEIVVLE